MFDECPRRPRSSPREVHSPVRNGEYLQLLFCDAQGRPLHPDRKWQWKPIPICVCQGPSLRLSTCFGGVGPRREFELVCRRRPSLPPRDASLIFLVRSRRISWRLRRPLAKLDALEKRGQDVLGITSAILSSSRADHELAALKAVRRESSNACLCCGLSVGCPLRRYFELLDVRCDWFHQDCAVTMLTVR